MLSVIFIIVAIIGIVGIARDLIKPYKTFDDERARALVANLFEQAAVHDLIVVAQSPGDAPPSLSGICGDKIRVSTGMTSSISIDLAQPAAMSGG